MVMKRSRTRSRTGKAKGGTRRVKTTKARTAPTLAKGGGAGTSRKATVKTTGGLTRTAKTSKTTTGSGAGRVVKKTRIITRVKNGVKTTKKVVFTNRGGKKTKTVTPAKTTKARKPRASKSGGVTAPRPRRGKRRR